MTAAERTANGSAAFNNYSGGADIGQVTANGNAALNGGADEVAPIAFSLSSDSHLHW